MERRTDESPRCLTPFFTLLFTLHFTVVFTLYFTVVFMLYFTVVFTTLVSPARGWSRCSYAANRSG